MPTGRPAKLPLVLLCVVILLVAFPPAWAAVPFAKHNPDLRVNPATGQEPKGLRRLPEEAQVLDDAEKSQGNYHLITHESERGRIGARNAEVDTSRNLEMVSAALVFHGCPAEGTATGRWWTDSGVPQNRTTAPGQADTGPSWPLQAMLAPDNGTHRGGAANAAEISGALHDVKLGGVETCHSRATDKAIHGTRTEVLLSAPASRRRWKTRQPRSAGGRLSTESKTTSCKTQPRGMTCAGARPPGICIPGPQWS